MEAQPAPTAECLLVRADAGESIGSGHVVRCLALAQAWQDAGGRAVFLSARLPEALHTRLLDEGCSVKPIDALRGSSQDAVQTLLAAELHQAAVVVADGYDFGSVWQRAVSSQRRLLLIDDGPYCTSYHADWVLNQNLSAKVKQYRGCAAAAQLLLGPRYALLGRQFAAGDCSPRSTPPQARKILVTLGGADPPNATRKVIEALALPEIGESEAIVIVGGSNPHRASLEAAAARSPRPMRLITDARNMAQHMAWADVAIAGGGSTLLELASLGVPALAVLVAENQRAPAEAAQRQGIARVLGWHSELAPEAIARQLAVLCRDADARAQMTRRGQETVDAQGAARVARALRRPKVRLRAATLDDCRRWWLWRNDPEARRVSFHSEAIPFAKHDEWYRTSLDDARRRLLVAEDPSRQALGFVRLDVAPQAVEISLALGLEHRGGGYGEPTIRLATRAALDLAEEKPIEALVKEDNAASRRVFEHADFELVERLSVAGHSALRMRYRPAA
jgi:UDP-2,4-diacetamido-2,4,6-trideoxy-beta-L-altropyranose hydrolase